MDEQEVIVTRETSIRISSNFMQNVLPVSDYAARGFRHVTGQKLQTVGRPKVCDTNFVTDVSLAKEGYFEPKEVNGDEGTFMTSVEVPFNLTLNTPSEILTLNLEEIREYHLLKVLTKAAKNARVSKLQKSLAFYHGMVVGHAWMFKNEWPKPVHAEDALDHYTYLNEGFWRIMKKLQDLETIAVETSVPIEEEDDEKTWMLVEEQTMGCNENQHMEDESTISSMSRER